MKRFLIRSLVAIVLLSVGFVVGRWFQHGQTGFHFEVREEKEYGSPDHPVRWRYVTETVGLPFLDPGTTVLEYRDRVIYKARRIFQESVPFAQNIKVSGNEIDWSDGELLFHLTIYELDPKKPDGAGAEVSR